MALYEQDGEWEAGENRGRLTRRNKRPNRFTQWVKRAWRRLRGR